MNWDKSKPWFHGSPIILTELLEGSTITQNSEIAKIFSHKPTVVSMDDQGGFFHNGSMAGYLYIIDEPLTPTDIFPHPNTTMEAGVEWLIHRPLKVKKIMETKVDPTQCLSEAEIKHLSKLL
ncbi:hypothetical protein J14TS2_25160 [Bacillus sp. J14TS2]|uniref:hypothetical protein n=1 Tax=Bacillus sp. J14TS2 TaxID=2807188 RepID=UPI001B238882|nr:hypothetical protein [Bacillus sp. J14TS2]GIN72041.1 hypothetical protein J14TS2_25160 [Bacillus sp. J14TS2]